MNIFICRHAKARCRLNFRRLLRHIRVCHSSTINVNSSTSFTSKQLPGTWISRVKPFSSQTIADKWVFNKVLWMRWSICSEEKKPFRTKKNKKNKIENDLILLPDSPWDYSFIHRMNVKIYDTVVFHLQDVRISYSS